MRLFKDEYLPYEDHEDDSVDNMSCRIEANKAKVWQIGLFSLNNTSTNLFLAMMGYISYYANGIAGLGVVLISFILTGLRIFDGVTDPIVGFVIDKSNGRFGKFRPFIIIGYILMSVSSLLIFYTTHLVHGNLRVPYFILLYTIYILGYTFQTSVVKSGQSIITNDLKQRSLITLFDSSFIMFAHGFTAFYVSVYLINKYTNFNNPGLFKEFVITIIIFAGLCSVLGIIGIWKKDNIRYFQVQAGEKNTVRFKDYIELLRYNRPVKMLMIVAASNRFASMVYGNATVIVMLYGILMNNYPLAGLIGIIIGFPNFGIIFLGIKYAQRVGQKKALVVITGCAIAFQMIFMGLMLFTDMTKVSVTHLNLLTFVFFLVSAILSGCKSITNNLVVPMIADCTDYEYMRSKRFVPGIMGALFSFVDKGLSSLGTAFVGIVLSFFGYAKVFPQVGDGLTPVLKSLTIFFFCIIPIVGWIISLITMKHYNLDKNAVAGLYEEFKEEID